MDFQLSSAVSYLEQAENELQRATIVAVQARDYRTSTRLSELSQRISEIRSAVGVGDGKVNGSDTNDESDEFSRTQEEASAESASKRKNDKGKSNSAYPRFLIREDQLVKLGWSSSNRREYEHRVPRESVEAFVEHVASLRKNRFPVTAESIVKALQKDDPPRILGYQVYVVAAWLKTLNFLLPEGRQGYFIADGVDLSSGVAAAWQDLRDESRNDSREKQ